MISPELRNKLTAIALVIPLLGACAINYKGSESNDNDRKVCAVGSTMGNLGTTEGTMLGNGKIVAIERPTLSAAIAATLETLDSSPGQPTVYELSNHIDQGSNSTLFELCSTGDALSVTAINNSGKNAGQPLTITAPSV